MRHSRYAWPRTILAAALAAAATASVAAQTRVRIETEWTFNASGAHPGSTILAALRVRVQDTFHVHSDQPLDEYLIPTVLTVTPGEGIAVRQIVYPEPILLTVSFSEEPLSVFENDFVIGVALDVGEDVAPGSYPIESTLGYQACDDKVCLAPTTLDVQHTLLVVAPGTAIERIESPLLEGIDFSAAPDGAIPVVTPPDGPRVVVETPSEDCDVVAELDEFAVLATAGGYLGAKDFLRFIDAAETGVVEKGLFEGRGPLVILLLIILGGIALNLTPCVLPLIPINLAIIGAGAQAGSRARGFALGGTYGLAMAAVYGVLGLVVILTASTFGAINSTIWFNVAIAVLFVVLALAMFDIIHIDFSKLQSRLDVGGVARRGTFALAFGMGAVAALLAGACVAPVVIQVIVYAGDQYARGTTLALALPFLLGVGMALPWPFAGAGLSFLPKPGAWMVRVKQAMGLFILAFAAYYAYLAWEIHDNRGGGGAGDASHALAEGWTGSICEGLATARAENRPVLVDMWATWCKNCFAMDRTTFRNAEVIARLDDYVKVKFQAEDLEASPAHEVLTRFEGIGLPTYAILEPPAGPEGTR